MRVVEGTNERKETVSYQGMRSLMNPSSDKAEAEETTLLFKYIAARAPNPCFYSINGGMGLDGRLGAWRCMKWAARLSIIKRPSLTEQKPLSLPRSTSTSHCLCSLWKCRIVSLNAISRDVMRNCSWDCRSLRTSKNANRRYTWFLSPPSLAFSFFCYTFLRVELVDRSWVILWDLYISVKERAKTMDVSRARSLLISLLLVCLPHPCGQVGYVLKPALISIAFLENISCHYFLSIYLQPTYFCLSIQSTYSIDPKKTFIENVSHTTQ